MKNEGTDGKEFDRLGSVLRNWRQRLKSSFQDLEGFLVNHKVLNRTFLPL